MIMRASKKQQEGESPRTRSKHVEPLSMRSFVRLLVRSFAPFLSRAPFPFTNFPSPLSSLATSDSRPIIISSSAGPPRAVPSSLPCLCPFLSLSSHSVVPSIVVTCNKWLDSPPHSLTRWKSASHPDSHRRRRPPPLLLCRKEAKVPLFHCECGWDHWDGEEGETFFTQHPSIHPLHSRSLTLCELRLINAFIKCEESVRVRSFVRLGNQRKIVIADADATQPQPRPQSRSLDLSAESCRVEHVRQAHN